MSTLIFIIVWLVFGIVLIPWHFGESDKVHVGDIVALLVFGPAICVWFLLSRRLK